MDKANISIDNGGQGWSYSSMDNQTHNDGEPPKSNYGNLPASAQIGEPTNSEIIAELNRVKCQFQLRTICAVLGVKP